MVIRRTLTMAALALVAGCSAAIQDPRRVFEDETVYRVFDEITDIIETRDAEGFAARVYPDPAQAAAIDLFKQALGLLPAEGPIELMPYYAELRSGGPGYEDVPVYLMVFDVVVQDGFANLLLAIAPFEGECCRITAIQLAPAVRLPSSTLDFSIEDQGPAHYAVLVLMVAIPLGMLATAAACIFKTGVRLKWLWVPFILIGLWGVEFNWATGEVAQNLVQVTPQRINFQFIQLNLLGVGVYKLGVLQPWIVKLGLPLGALLYWLIPARRPQPTVPNQF